MTEDEFIRLISKGAPTGKEVVHGIGDDCAVIDVGLQDKWLLLKTDVIVEQVHFLRDAPPHQIGHKALARALSDIAAMAGVPGQALIMVCIPSIELAGWIKEVYDGIYQCARRFGVSIVGGETSHINGPIVINVCLSGLVEKDRCKTRRGAKPGHGLFLTGELGGSLDGKHLTFTPRIREARWLTEHFPISAMIDLSDGLASDLRRLLSGEGLGAELYKEAIPISLAAKNRFKEGRSKRPPFEAALADGEDYELLFTLPPGYAVQLVDSWKSAFPDVKLSCIGKVIDVPEIRVQSRRTVEVLGMTGFDHLHQAAEKFAQGQNAQQTNAKDDLNPS